MMCSLIVEKIAEKLREKQNVAVISFQEHQITGGAFWSMIVKSADLLRQSGNSKKIAISLATSPEALAVFLAGLIVAEETGYFDPCWSSSVTQRVTDLFGAQILIDANWSQLDLIANPHQISIHPEAMPTGQDLSRFTCFTSGSTGLPKGCRRSEQSWINSFKADHEFTNITPADWVVIPGQFAHSLFLYAAVRGLFAGASIALFSTFNPKKISKFIEDTDTSVIFGVPTQLEVIAQTSVSASRGLKGIMITGAKLPARSFQKLHQAYPDASICEFYGTTELSYVAAREVRADDPSTLIGKPFLGVEVTIRDHAQKNITDDKFGTVYVKSDMAFDGYVTEQGFRPAQKIFTVGDSGYLDDTGALHLQGRVDRVFQSSGRKIIPENIEHALTDLDDIALAAVIPVSDSIRENRICAVIQLNVAIDRADLIKRLKTSLSSYEIPHQFYLCEDWPKTAGGKTDFLLLSRFINLGSLETLA